jgi:hypothetical protein
MARLHLDGKCPTLVGQASFRAGRKKMTGPHRSFDHDGILLSPISEQDVADRWKKSVRTLQRWRRDGYGPAYLRIGGTIHYRMCDVLAFEAANLCGRQGAK